MSTTKMNVRCACGAVRIMVKALPVPKLTECVNFVVGLTRQGATIFCGCRDVEVEEAVVSSVKKEA